ncbi:hypothetical protein PT974_09664 [Cladobotryum mycophilum]|uniref:Ankyrin repeat protein n=1 Tax=Cladobotryum mycophilum TaxID=491253 RepID=A0ABR0SGV5_9HYPO
MHQAALQGKLNTPEDLEQYRLAATSQFDIDEVDSSSRTALACGAWKGHANVVKLLVNEGANINKLNKRSRSALWYATSDSMNSDRRLAVMSHLLDRGAQPDLPAQDGTTALMKLIEHRDAKGISLLVERGASTTLKKEPEGITIQDLANKTNERAVIEALNKPHEKSSTQDIASVVLMYMLWVVGYINDIVQGSLKRLYGLAGTSVDQTRKEMQDNSPETLINEPDRDVDDDVADAAKFDTPEEFKQSMHKFVDETGISAFFGKDDDFLRDIAERAAQLKNDPFSRLNTAEDVQNLTRLALYSPILYCDDSSSMMEDDRRGDQIEIARRIASISTRLVPDGYGSAVQFINHTEEWNDKLTVDQVFELMMRVKPRGTTKIGTNLKRKILNPLVYEHIGKGGRLNRPLFISVITDGSPSAEREDTFKNEILECISFLQDHGYDDTAVRFQISQIGNDEHADNFLRGLQSDQRLKDYLFVTAQRLDEQFKKLKENEEHLERWLLQTLTQGIMSHIMEN